MSFRSKRKFTRFALAATLGMAVVMGCAGTFAHAADDDDDELLDTKILKGILKGLGLRGRLGLRSRGRRQQTAEDAKDAEKNGWPAQRSHGAILRRIGRRRQHRQTALQPG